MSTPEREARPDIFEVADLLVSHAVASHGDDVDLIGYYGSHAQGVATARSDLDIFYTPKNGTRPPVNRTVLIDRVLFDFWAIPWETLEGFATGRIRGWTFAPAVVHHARVLHARTDEQLARFAAIRQRVIDLQEPEAQVEMIGRAVNAFPLVMTHLGNLRLAVAANDPASVRHAGWMVILASSECLTLANQVFFDRGCAHIREELSRLPSKPVDMEERVVTICTSSDPREIAAAAEQLALGTRGVLREFQDLLPARQDPGEAFEGAYPEINDMMRKVIEAGDRNQPVASSAAAWSLQAELSAMLHTGRGTRHRDFNLYHEFAALYRQLDLPDLMAHPAGDPDRLAEDTRRLDTRLRQWLCEHSIGLNEYETVAEFRRSLEASS